MLFGQRPKIFRSKHKKFLETFLVENVRPNSLEPFLGTPAKLPIFSPKAIFSEFFKKIAENVSLKINLEDTIFFSKIVLTKLRTFFFVL